MLLFGLLMLFAAGLSQFFGFAAIAFDDIELPDDMELWDAMAPPDMAFVAVALVQLCVALMALWLLIALPLDMAFPLDIELPCAKA